MITRSADIHVKRVYDAPSPEDGARILVDRVWPRGQRKQALALTLWLKDIAPSPALRKWFGHDPVRFDEFAAHYRAEVAANADALDRIDGYLNAGRVTLLYAAHDTVHNQANVLRDYLLQRERHQDQA